MVKELKVNSQQELFDKIGCGKVFVVFNGGWAGCYLKDTNGKIRCNMMDIKDDNSEYNALKSLDWDFFKYIDDMSKGLLLVDVYGSEN